MKPLQRHCGLALVSECNGALASVLPAHQSRSLHVCVSRQSAEVIREG